MARFQIIGKGRDTGRQRKRIYTARDADDARTQAAKDGIEVAEVAELPPEPPTENQIAYATSLGIQIPVGATGEEVSDLISYATERDKPSSPELKALAASYGAKVTQYTGKKLVFERVFVHLTTTPDRQQDLAAWFAFRVYRELVHGAAGTAIASPNDEIIQEVARQLAAAPDVMQSIRRYNGQDLIWFGQWTSPDGVVRQGGSNRTIAYKRAAELLRPMASKAESRRIEIPERHYERSKPTSAPSVAPQAKGCFTVLVMGVGLVLLLSTAAAAILGK